MPGLPITKEKPIIEVAIITGYGETYINYIYRMSDNEKERKE